MTATNAVSWSLLRTFLLPSCRVHRQGGLRARRAPGSEPGQGRDLLAVGAAVAVGMGVRLAALEEEVQVVLPREADAAVDLERRPGHAPAGVARVGLRAGDGERRGLGLEVERPGSPVDRR